MNRDPYVAELGDLVCFYPGALERTGDDVYDLLEMGRLRGFLNFSQITRFQVLKEQTVGLVLHEFGNTFGDTCWIVVLTPEGVRIFASSSWGTYMMVLLRKECVEAELL